MRWFFFFSSRRRHTRCSRDWSSDVCSSDLDVDAVKRGAANVRRHIRNVKQFGVPVVVALNRFLTDSEAELDAVRAECAAEGVGVELCEVWEKGGEGGVAVAQAVLKLL